MAFSSFPNVYSWIQNLPPIHQSKNINPITNSMNLCSSCSSQPSLKLSINYLKNSSFCLTIFADYNIPIHLWNSKTIEPNSTPSDNLLDDATITTLLINFIEDKLKYSPTNCVSTLNPTPTLSSESNIQDLFNYSFLSLTYIVCIYEAPKDIRSCCINELKEKLACNKARDVSKVLMRHFGSNVEEQCIRSMNLAITNWISENRAENIIVPLKPLSPMFCYAVSTLGLWKVQLYCPVIAMNAENSSGSFPERLMFSLNYHQLEGVIQLNHRVTIKENWIDVTVNTDNIRCDVVKLLTDKLMNVRGVGTSEKHFPSRITLEVTPILQSNVISVSVSKSSDNPFTEIGVEKGIEASFQPPNAIGLNFSAGETKTTSLKPWKFEQMVFGNRGNLNWFLHDSVNGREVYSSRPSKCALLFHPKAWFRHRYSKANRPFTKRGGVIFAGDEYGERLSWKVDKACMGKTMEWEIKGWIWLTYWPNKHMTFYTETRKLEFREIVHLNLV